MASNHEDEGVDTVDAAIATHPVSLTPPLRTKDSPDSSDEGFHSPSINTESTSKSSFVKDKNVNNKSNDTVTPIVKNLQLKSNKKSDESNKAKCCCKTKQLTEFIVQKMLSDKIVPQDKVEVTLFSCVNDMMTKHEIKFKSMMCRLNIDSDSGFQTFVTILNEIFEGDKNIVNWGRIVALYSFTGQIALYCKEKKMIPYATEFSKFVGQYACEKITDFILKEGGWDTLYNNFASDEDRSKIGESNVWSFLTWTAVGLSVATTMSFLASR